MQPEKREVRICQRNNSVDNKVCAEGRQRGAPGPGAEISLHPEVKTMEKELCPCNPWRTTRMLRSICCPWRSPWEVHAGTRGPMKRGTHDGAVCLVGLVTVGNPCWSRLFLTDTHQKVTHIVAFYGELFPVRWTHIVGVHGGLSPIGGTSHCSRTPLSE